MNRKITVLVVDDSPTMRQMLINICATKPMLQVIGEATNGAEAVRLAQRLKPDVISMDIHMPVMDGLKATVEIMRMHPTPIVMVSGSLAHAETDVAFDAVKAGALAVIQKPPSPDHPDFQAVSDEFTSTLQTMADVFVIHHHRHPGRAANGGGSPLSGSRQPRTSIEIIGIASSTGGPTALSVILSQLPADFPIPLVIVQHISEGFEEGLAHWLNTLSSLPVAIARAGERIEPRRVLIAPGGKHMRVTASRHIVLEPNRGTHLNIPSADIMLHSMAEAYGSRSVGIVLTGMGSDGAQGLRAVYENGGITIAQDEASSVVFGMPKEAIALGAATYILPIDQITRALTSIAFQHAF